MRKKRSAGKKILISLLLFILLLALAFHIFITRYLPPLLRDRLNDVIVKGSGSLYKFEVGKIVPGFCGNSFRFSNLHIYIDSTKYKELKEAKRLPGLTFDLDLPKGNIKNIGLPSLIIWKKLKLDLIDFAEATVHLSRHFRTSENNSDTTAEPLWKLIRPTLRSIAINRVVFRDIKIGYNNVDSATAFAWQFDKCYAAFSGILVDSLSARDSSRLLFASNLALEARNIKMKTPDGLYGISANSIFYSSSVKSVEVKEFGFNQAVDNGGFTRHFGYQHEIYSLSIPAIRLRNFSLPRWISYNELKIDTVELQSPGIGVYLDRNAPSNPYSKLGKYPHQLLQKAPFGVHIKRLTAINGTLTYREKNNKNQLTGKLIFPAMQGYIDHITNDSAAIASSPECVANIHSGILQTGIMHTVFRFNLADKSGGFHVTASITNLNAPQMQPLIKAMTSAEMQSFNLHRLDYVITGNESSGTGQLRMIYGDMDVLLNKVNDDGSLDKKGLLSFLVNRLVIYKENPMNDGEERMANNIPMHRDATRSFFNFIWKTLYSSAGKIVLRPVAQRKIEKRRKRNTD
jgi:hypothetical protein